MTSVRPTTPRPSPDGRTAPAPAAGTLARVGIAGLATYLPERWMTAAEVARASGIPEEVIVEKFGLRGKHIAAPDEHVSDLSVAAAERLLAAGDVDRGSIDVVLYFGSTWKDYGVWQAAPWIAHRLGCSSAYCVEYDNVSYGAPAALRVARAMLVAEPELRTVLLVGACRESYLLDYANERSRFMFTFGDGAVAALLAKDHPRHEVLGSHGYTDGSLSLQVKVGSGGSVDPSGDRYLDVADPPAMKERLDAVSLDRFVHVAETALARSGARLQDLAYLCGIHMKPSMHRDVVRALGLQPERAAYLDDTGHMSGIDPLVALDRASRSRVLRAGDLALVLAAGTGYTWAATVLRWGPVAG